MSSFFKNFIMIAGFLLIAALGYYLFVMERDGAIDTSAANVKQGEIETAKFLSRLRDLQQIELSSDIFSDARFRSLIDFGTEVEAVPVGRATPFR